MYRLRDYSLRREQRLGVHLRQQVPTKASYCVDLPRFLSLCEANFIRLKKLTGSMQREALTFTVVRGEVLLAHQLTLVERAKFTSTWCFTYNSAQTSRWLPSPNIILRAYHDAAMVEVLQWQGHKRLRPVYPQPNAQAYARDEKLQVNQFLGEWLDDCLAEGMSGSVTGEGSA